jgi:flagellar basal body rod protein FlgG
MDALMTAAASGLRARLESLDLLANNIANQATAGYKADREFYSLYESEHSSFGGGGLAPVIQENWTDHSQGTLQRTGDPAHMALDGPGYFRVQGPSGELLTRSGAFRLNADGRLVSPDGYPLLDASGKPAELDPREPFHVTADGELQQRGRAAIKIGIAGVPDTAALKKHHGTYFHSPEGAVAGRARVLQEHLEGANVSGPESSIRLIEVLRQFESLQKAIHISGEMSRSAAEIARVGG